MPGFKYFLILLPLMSSVHADELRLSSGKEQNILMELYTSEGCSSCPPMEHYLNSFISHEALWRTYIPVAFHVDYWNYIGWEDRFSHPAFAQRQRQHARQGNVSSVYTPALIINGKGWRPGFVNQFPRVGKKTTGRLEVSVDHNKLKANYKHAIVSEQTLTLHIALLGMGLQSAITAGENKGRKLDHQFVVIAYDRIPGSEGSWQLSLPRTHVENIEPRAIAVWVSEDNEMKPLQAVGGYLNK